MPSAPLTIAVVFGWLVAVLFSGSGIARLRSTAASRSAAWLLGIIAVVGVERLTMAEPAGVRMLGIIAALLWAMKALPT